MEGNIESKFSNAKSLCNEFIFQERQKKYDCVNVACQNIKPFSLLKWDFTWSGRTPLYDIRVVPVEAIHSPAMVPKYQPRSESPVLGHPRSMDRFWLVPPKFTDRAGWNDVASINFPNLIETSLAPRV